MIGSNIKMLVQCLRQSQLFKSVHILESDGQIFKISFLYFVEMIPISLGSQHLTMKVNRRRVELCPLNQCWGSSQTKWRDPSLRST